MKRALIIEVEMRVQELKCWEIRTSQMRVLATPLEVDSRRMHFLIEANSLLSSLGKMIGEQHKIIGIAQAEAIRHKRGLWKFIERSLRIKKDI